MQEALLHYIWKNALLEHTEYLADTGEHIRIIHYGVHNTNAGPDFTDVKIEIEGTLWAGNAEIHSLASDWYRHQHHNDAAYNNVILHIVQENDRACHNTQGRRIPAITLSPDPSLIHTYQQLMISETKIPCAPELELVDQSRIQFWLSALAVERLSSKADKLRAILTSTLNDWEESYYISLCRSFGLKLNALPFELLARSLSLKIIRQQPENRFRTEALLFGQAGFLSDNKGDDYYLKLREEYLFCKKKFGLQALESHVWKFLRLRPLNFPTIRIAQLSTLLSRGTGLFSRLLEFRHPDEIVDFFSCDVSDYWKNHYTFGNRSVSREKKPGRQMLYSLIINTAVPFLFVYGERKNINKYREQALQWLEQIPPENNRVVQAWSNLGIKAKHGADSQALLELNARYCSVKKCLHCQIGHQILTKKKNEKG